MFSDDVPKPNFGGLSAEKAFRKLLQHEALAFQRAYTRDECEQLLEAIRLHRHLIKSDPGLTGKLTDSGIQSAVVPIAIQDNLMAAMKVLERSIVDFFSSTDALPEGFQMNMPGIQVYPAGCAGLESHRDLLSYGNLVVNLTLAGSGKFTVRNREGIRTSYQLRPGTLVVMVAPGFAGLKLRPYHEVGPMPEGRTFLCLRQKVQVKERSMARLRPSPVL